MSLVFPSIFLIGLPLVAIPLMIHIINLRRQRRIRWAAMEFLLESQRRHKNWILLRQLLLLLLRTVAIAALVLMLARPILSSQWARLIGGAQAHHLVLLDDSYSMSDQLADGESVMSVAERAVRAIAEQAASQAGTHSFSLLTFDEARQLSAGSQPRIFQQPVTTDLLQQLESTLAATTVTQSNPGPVDALAAIERLPVRVNEETLIVYVISDFRARQWHTADSFSDSLSELDRLQCQVHLVDCVDEEHDNLAITQLAPTRGVRAAGVEMWMDVRVENYGPRDARQVTVELVGESGRLPALVFDEVAAGSEVTQQFRVRFPTAGACWLEARLNADAIAVDNRRYFAAQLPISFPVLIIDDSARRDDAFYIVKALQPNAATKTGWSPQVEEPSYLRSGSKLSEFAAVLLLDVPRLQPPQLDALTSYVRQGGGLAVFVGERTQADYYTNQLYREGAGIFPAPLSIPTQLTADPGAGSPDIRVEDNGPFQVLAGRRNSFVDQMIVQFYYATPTGWRLPTNSAARVLVTLRGGDPIVLEQAFGDGRVVAQLTKLSPAETTLGRWNNWALNPAFPVLANELVGYLSSTRRAHNDQTVGEPWLVTVAAEQYEPLVRFTIPDADPTARPRQLPVRGTTVGEELRVSAPSTASSGLYGVTLIHQQDGQQQRRLAVNVPPDEGDLRLAAREQIELRLAGLDLHFHRAGQMLAQDRDLAGFEISRTLIGILVAALVLEQLLAYAASYHPARRRGDR